MLVVGSIGCYDAPMYEVKAFILANTDCQTVHEIVTFAEPAKVADAHALGATFLNRMDEILGNRFNVEAICETRNSQFKLLRMFYNTSAMNLVDRKAIILVSTFGEERATPPPPTRDYKPTTEIRQ
ncbi:MAG: hypothetical protein V1763_02565 [Parcubacteria group bacterium]